MGLMNATKKWLAIALACAAGIAPGWGEELRTLDSAPVLPLSLDDAFEFRKVKTLLVDARRPPMPGGDRMINFERERVYWGAVTGQERRENEGQTFTFFWRANREAAVTLRFEYRQANLGSYVMAKEYFYPAAKGSIRTEFAVKGDDYHDDGRVTSWRAILIEDGRIVGLTQSFLWN